MTLKSIDVWVIYQIKTLEHSMVSSFLIPESLNEISANDDIFALRCRISVDSRPNQRNKAAFLNSSGVVCTRPECMVHHINHSHNTKQRYLE